MMSRRAALAFLAGAAAALLAGLASANAAGEAFDAEAEQVAFFRAVQIDDDRTVKAVLARGLDPNLHDPQRGDRSHHCDAQRRNARCQAAARAAGLENR